MDILIKHNNYDINSIFYNICNKNYFSIEKIILKNDIDELEIIYQYNSIKILTKNYEYNKVQLNNIENNNSFLIYLSGIDHKIIINDTLDENIIIFEDYKDYNLLTDGEFGPLYNYENKLTKNKIMQIVKKLLNVRIDPL
jgi:hypothetical protein